MTLDEVLASLFEGAFTVDERPDGILLGEGRLGPGQTVCLIGIVHGNPLGIEGALTLAHRVLTLVRGGQRQPILVLVDGASQRMSRRDELLGLNEYLSHLAKSLSVADAAGFPTIALLYGGGAAGAFVTTALATRVLVAVPGAHPAVMDMPSISRVTKLPIERLERMSANTPVFAPGLANMQAMGAITETWDPHTALRGQLLNLLQRVHELAQDLRDQAGQRSGGRLKAALIADTVMQQALQRPAGQ